MIFVNEVKVLTEPMLVFYFAAAIVIWLGILSLRNGINFASYIRREISQNLPDYAPFASVIAPARGLDQGLRENITSLFIQDYPDYEILFVTDRHDDPSVAVIEEVTKSQKRNIPTRLVIAGSAVETGQKVHNLSVAVTQVDPRSEVLVFVDTDARPHDAWLKALVATLANKQIGAATGYRWFVPLSDGLASHLRSVWNASIASALGERSDKNFCWGGSTAIRRKIFEDLRIKDRWQGTVSDDFTMTRVLHDAKLLIHFVPACLLPSFDSCNMRELFEFTNRQLKITRVYAAHLWKSVLIGSFLFCTIFFGGIMLAVARAVRGLEYIPLFVLLVVIYALGTVKALVRLRAVAIVLKDYREVLHRGAAAQLCLWPVASALFLWNALAAAFSRRIEWRGISYELKSANNTVIIRKK